MRPSQRRHSNRLLFKVTFVSSTEEGCLWTKQRENLGKTHRIVGNWDLWASIWEMQGSLSQKEQLVAKVRYGSKFQTYPTLRWV